MHYKKQYVNYVLYDVLCMQYNALCIIERGAYIPKQLTKFYRRKSVWFWHAARLLWAVAGALPCGC